MTEKKAAVLILIFGIGAVPMALCCAASETKTELLREGFILNGVDGRLTTTSTDIWFFRFDVEVADGKARIEPGQSLRLLPSSTLEKMAAAAKADAAATYRLWGRITRYENENFIFPVYYLPVSEAEPVEEPSEPPVPAEPNVNEPGDAVVIPDEVLQLLKPKRVVTVARVAAPVDLERDSVFIDRAGFITEGAPHLRKRANGDSEPKGSAWAVFELDSLGRNMQGVSLHLLPCEALQRAQAEKAIEPGRLRYKVTGILTEYKGQRYLLLQRAMRLYSHGNFAR